MKLFLTSIGYFYNFVKHISQLVKGQETISQPFNNAQLELLKLFSSNVPEEDLKAIKELISKYFLEKAKDEADQIWEKRGLDSDELLKVHRRKPYRKIQS